jgi:hypothetical protein
MKTTRIVFAFLLLLTGTLAAQTAFADGPYRGGYHGGYRGGYGGGHWHSSFGFYFGVPIGGYPYYAPYYSPYYYPAYSYYSAPVVVQQQSPVYVEQNPQPAASAQPSAPAGYWYYCAGSNAYYPYVKECPAGWQRVAPQPGG